MNTVNTPTMGPKRNTVAAVGLLEKNESCGCSASKGFLSSLLTAVVSIPCAFVFSFECAVVFSVFFKFILGRFVPCY